MKIFDRTLQTLSDLVDRFMARVDYFALYSAVVVSQSGNFLDVQPDDLRLPGMNGIPIQNGIPGCTAEVQSGSRILVGWMNGDPRRPYAALWSGETVNVINLQVSDKVTINGSISPVVRVGDAVTITGTGPADGVIAVTGSTSKLKA